MDVAWISVTAVLDRLHDNGYGISRRTLYRRLHALGVEPFSVGGYMLWPSWVVAAILRDAGVV